MGRAAVAIILSEAERRELEGLARRRKTAQGLARRARIVLAAAEGLENKAIVERLGADANTVGYCRAVAIANAGEPHTRTRTRNCSCLRPDEGYGGHVCCSTPRLDAD